MKVLLNKCSLCGQPTDLGMYLCESCEDGMKVRIRKALRPMMGVSGRSIKSVLLPTIAKHAEPKPRATQVKRMG
jgi:hypothetical protein